MRHNTKNQNSKKKGSEVKEDFDFEQYQKEVVAGLIAGKGLLGEEGLMNDHTLNQR